MPWFHLRVSHQTLLSREEAWDFLGTISNLEQMTPKHMRFKLLSDPLKKIEMGSVLAYSIRPLPFLKMIWVSEISAYEPLKRFCDTQLSGPYASWIHEHRIEGEDNGPCTLIDEVFFELPFGVLGSLAYALYVKSALLKAFSYRRDRLNELTNNDLKLEYQLTLKRIKA
ncbi:MAG: SRPBCC family protein [Flavobacteriaceae bacterium]